MNIIARTSIIAAVFSTVLLSGCSSVSSALNEIGPTSLKPPQRIACVKLSGNRADAVQCAETLASTYAQRTDQLLSENTILFDLPLIGAAVAGAASLFYGGHADLNFGIGLGATSLGGLRSYANANTIADKYLWGEEVALCIHDKTTWFDTNPQVEDELKNLSAGLDREIGFANTLIGDVTSGRSAASEEAVAAAQAAIRAAASASSSATQALAAYAKSGDVAMSTLWKLDTKVRKEIKDGRPDLQSIIDDLKSKLTGLQSQAQTQTAGTTGAAEAEMLADAAGIAEDAGALEDVSEDLKTHTSEIARLTKAIVDKSKLPTETLLSIRACTAEAT